MNTENKYKRYSINWPVDLHERAKKAAALKGHESLKNYLVELVDRDANETIKDHSTLKVSNEDFDKFAEAIQCDAK